MHIHLSLDRGCLRCHNPIREQVRTDTLDLDSYMYSSIRSQVPAGFSATSGVIDQSEVALPIAEGQVTMYAARRSADALLHAPVYTKELT